MPPPAIETRRCDGCDADFRPAAHGLAFAALPAGCGLIEGKPKEPSPLGQKFHEALVKAIAEQGRLYAANSSILVAGPQ